FGINEANEVVTFQDILSTNPEGNPVFIDQLHDLTDPKFGLGVDLGLKSKLPVLPDLKPEVGFAWMNVGSPGFGDTVGNPQTITVGAAVHPDWWKLKNIVAVDFAELNRDRPFLSQFHFGVETQTPWWTSVRLGCSQGYFTGGLTFAISFFQLDFAYYAEEIGI